MFTLRVRVKLLLLLILALSTLGLNKAQACSNQHCIFLYSKTRIQPEPIGYGCVPGGSFIECWATVDGCTILYCAE